MSRPTAPASAPLSRPAPDAITTSSTTTTPGALPSRRTPSSSLAEALHNAGVTLDGQGGTRARQGSESPSEEAYEENVRTASVSGPGVVRFRPGRHSGLRDDSPGVDVPVDRIVRRDSGVHIVSDDDKSLRELLQASSERAHSPKGAGAPRKRKFADLVFTRQFSAFDRQNPWSTNSPFHGFYTLFWLGVAFYVFKISAQNWSKHGSPLGTSDIVKTMFSRDVFVLLLSDGIMCGITGVSWVIQKLVLYGYLNWSRSGWVIQSLWQMAFMAGVVGLTLWREWPWTHTVFFVLHGTVMLMKQHSYAFYNGHLSTVSRKRAALLAKLKQLDGVPTTDAPTSQTDPPAAALSTEHLGEVPSAAQRRRSLARANSSGDGGTKAGDEDEASDIDRISQAIASGEPLDDAQVELFERIIKWEVDALADELQGTASDASAAYPRNLTFANHYAWIPLPTLVYELEYPRSGSISWSYVAEKMAAMIGVLFVMVQISQSSIYPIVMYTVEMKEAGTPLGERLQQFPWLLSELMFPFMMEYLLVWYLIWETILNILAELTYFADRNFYDAWWNCVSWDQFAREWNRPVHVFLLRHVYHSSISSLKVNKYTATLITFFLSACFHELVMWCLFKKLRGYLLFLQMCQLPLVRLSRTKWLKGRKTLGNLFFWMGIFTAPSLLCSLYLIL